MWRDGKLLATTRRNVPWDFGLPGGKIDPNETPEDALRREVLEETGVVATEFTPIFEDLDRVENGKARPCRCYLVLKWEGEPRSVEPGIDVKWVTPGRLADTSCSFHQYNRALFAHLDVETP